MTGYIWQNSNVIAVRQGDSFVIRLQLKKGQEVIDLTGSKVEMQVRRLDDNELMFALQATEMDIKQGKVALILTPEQTKIDVGDYKTDIQVTFADGTVNTIFPADVNRVAIFKITEQVTNG